jgi:AraC-like DNA-binding protein
MLRPENFYLLPPNTSFAADLDRPVGHLYLHFTVGAPYAALTSNVFAFPVLRDLRIIAEELGGLLLSNGAGESRTALLAATLIHYGLSRIPMDLLPKSPQDARIGKVLRRLDEDSVESPDNEQLARLANMAPNAFIRLFRKTVGVSPQAYARRRRIDRACQLLHFSSQSIKEIAETCGFCDRYQFSKAFKKERRMGPAEYRRRMEPTGRIV